MARDRRPPPDRGPRDDRRSLEPALYDLDPADRRDGAIMPMVRIGAAPGRPRGVLVVLGLFVLVALALPILQGQGAAPDAGAATPRPAPTVAATLRPTPDPARPFCLEPSGWRVTAVFLWGDRTVQSWQLMQPVVADGPRDPAIVFQPYISTKVKYVGWCAPSIGDGQPDDDLRVSAWRMAGNARPVPLRDAHAASARARLGGLYTAPSGREWAPGRYVFHLSGEGIEHWFGVEVVRFDPDRSPEPSGD